MNASPLRISPSRADLAASVATALLSRIAAAQTRGEIPHIGLTGGSVADDVHREIARLSPTSAVDWSQVVLWWGDERWLPAGAPERNEVQARAAFIGEVGVDPTRVHTMAASDEGLSLSEAAAAYGATMQEVGAGFFEVLMLGVGPDGHVASLFPGHPAVAITDALAVGVEHSTKPPPERISLTFEAMHQSRAVWFVAAGEEKATAVAHSYKATAVPGSAAAIACPARVPRGRQETLWWLDLPAASKIN